VQARDAEVAEVLRKNAFMAELHSRIVPLVRARSACGE
jgi:hypothetical protein